MVASVLLLVCGDIFEHNVFGLWTTMSKIFCGVIETLQNKTHVVGKTIHYDIYRVRTLANISIQLDYTKTKRNTSSNKWQRFDSVWFGLRGSKLNRFKILKPKPNPETVKMFQTIKTTVLWFRFVFKLVTIQILILKKFWITISHYFILFLNLKIFLKC